MWSKERNEIGSYSKLTNLSKALASPIRISILRRLMCDEEWVNDQTLGEIPGEKKLVIRHAKALVYLGIIESKFYDRKAYYRIRRDAFFKMSEEFNELFDLFKKSLLKRMDID